MGTLANILLLFPAYAAMCLLERRRFEWKGECSPRNCHFVSMAANAALLEKYIFTHERLDVYLTTCKAHVHV